MERGLHNTGRGGQKDRVRARHLPCYWTVAQLGMSMVDPAKKCVIASAALSVMQFSAGRKRQTTEVTTSEDLTYLNI